MRSLAVSVREEKRMAENLSKIMRDAFGDQDPVEKFRADTIDPHLDGLCDPATCMMCFAHKHEPEVFRARGDRAGR